MSHSFFFLYWSYTGGTKVPIGNYPLNVMLTPSANPWESTGKPQGAHEIKTSPVFHPPSCIPFFFKSGFQELTCIPKTKNFKKRVFPFFLKPYFSSGLAFPKQIFLKKVNPKQIWGVNRKQISGAHMHFKILQSKSNFGVANNRY